MLALVATPRFLLLVDLESRRVSVIEDGRQEYYGITWRPGGDQLILSHSGLDNESLVDLESYALSEVGWISAGPLHSSRFLSQPHQILCGPDGRVICTNTGRNSVVVIDNGPADAKLCQLGRAGGPVIFTDPGGSGLTYTFTSLASATDSLEFSSNSGGSWNHVPAADAQGCDSNVTGFRVRPGGGLGAGRSFTLRVRYIIE